MKDRVVMTEYTKSTDHLPDQADDIKSHWYLVDMKNMNREELIRFAKRFCSMDKYGKSILWLQADEASKMGLKEWNKGGTNI